MFRLFCIIGRKYLITVKKPSAEPDSGWAAALTDQADREQRRENMSIVTYYTYIDGTRQNNMRNMKL